MGRQSRPCLAAAQRRADPPVGVVHQTRERSVREAARVGFANPCRRSVTRARLGRHAATVFCHPRREGSVNARRVLGDSGSSIMVISSGRGPERRYRRPPFLSRAHTAAAVHPADVRRLLPRHRGPCPACRPGRPLAGRLAREAGVCLLDLRCGGALHGGALRGLAFCG